MIEAAHRAGLDEIRHAQLCFALASRYARAPVSPGQFPFGGDIAVEDDLASLAARVVVEGCVGETIAAVHAREQLVRAVDPAVREVLRTIVEDESRHAELAFETVGWAIAIGGARVRAAVSAAFANALRAGPPGDDGNEATLDLSVHGRLSTRERAEISIAVREEIVRPLAEALVGEHLAAHTTKPLVASSDLAT